MLIDDVLSKWDAREYHEIRVATDAGRVYEAIRTTDFSRSVVIRTLFRLRGMPPKATRIGGLEDAGFVLVAETPDEEFVLGLVGKFWTLTGGIKKIPGPAFSRFERPGFAKAAWNFAVRRDRPGRVTLSTETRVRCTDPRSRLLFRLYWTLIGPFSGWIRREVLRCIRREAMRPE